MSIPPQNQSNAAKPAMQRSAVVALLLVVFAIAWLVVSRSGLFNRSAPVPLIREVPLAPVEISAILNAWTYPGAKASSSTLSLPPVLNGKAYPWPKYIRRLEIAEPLANVRGFYAGKLGVSPNTYVAGANDGGVVPAQVTWFANSLQAATAIPSSTKSSSNKQAWSNGMNGGSFTYTTLNYMVEAMISSPSQRQTQVILLLVPLGGNDPLASSQRAQP